MTPLLIPATGERANSLEAARRQVDRLPAVQNGFDDVRSEESKGQGATDLADIPVMQARKISQGVCASLYKIIEPSMGIRKNGDEFTVGRWCCLTWSLDYELRFDPSPF